MSHARTILAKLAVTGAFTFLLGSPLGVAAMENRDLYFGGTVKEHVGDVAEIKIRGTLTELGKTELPTTIVVNVSGKSYIVEINAKTKIVRKYGGKSSLEEFVAGDFLEVKGKLLESGAIQAKKVKDFSIFLVNDRGVNGWVKSIDPAAGSFVVTWKNADYTILTDANTRIVVPGITLKGTINDLKVGDRIRGRALYRTTTGTLTAKLIVVLKHDGISLLKPRTVNFEGTLTKLESTTIPTTIEVTTEDGEKTYNVHVMEDTVIVRKHFGKSTLAEFAVGDEVRVIGYRDASDPMLIHAKVLKNDSLKSLSEINVDTDEDGIPDARDAKPLDHDNDGINDPLDADDDSDGIADIRERPAIRFDHDNDGVKDAKDADDDNDGIKDADESGKEFDHDNDGIADAKDADDDADGIDDVDEGLYKDLDHDNDGVRDDRDEDDDNDGTKDGEDSKLD